MTYYNPKVYNYSNLKDKDKEIIDCICITALDAVENAIVEKEDELVDEEVILEKIRLQSEISALIEVEQNIQLEMIELMVSTIEHYPEEFQDEDLKNTDDHFYGCPYFTEKVDGLDNDEFL